MGVFSQLKKYERLMFGMRGACSINRQIEQRLSPG